MKLKLKNIKQDPELLRLRNIDRHFVSRYRQAFREGSVFPPIIIDQNNFIVSGNHRYAAFLQELGEEAAITVVKKKFTTEKKRLEFFTRENTTHGNPLDTHSRTKISIKLINLGSTADEVAAIFGVSVKKIIEWGDNQVMVMMGNGNCEMRPVKKGLENKHKPMTEAEHNTHTIKDRGVCVSQQVNQLLRWIAYDRVARTDKNTQLFAELHELLQEWLDTGAAENITDLTTIEDKAA